MHPQSQTAVSVIAVAAFEPYACSGLGEPPTGSRRSRLPG
jgi:hypothetical protein